MSAAVRADRDLRIRELLDLFGSFVTFRAFVFVEWHGCEGPSDELWLRRRRNQLLSLILMETAKEKALHPLRGAGPSTADS